MKNLLLLLALIIVQHTAIAQPKKAATTKKSVVTAPLDADSLDRKIMELYQAHEFAQTIDVINVKLKQKPNDTARVIVKAMCHAMLRQKEACVTTIRTFFTAPDTAANLLASIPTYLSKEVAKEDGLWYCDQAIAMSSTAALPYMIKAALIAEEGDYAKAKPIATKGYDLGNDKLKRMMGGTYAKILMKSGDGPKAYEVITALTAKYPDDLELARNHYAMLTEEKKYDQALKLLNSMMVGFAKDSLRLMKERAFLYQDMGRKEDACKEIDRLSAADEKYDVMYENFECGQAYANLSPGTVKTYTYAVNYNGLKYKFKVSPVSINMQANSSFNWAMTHRDNMKGLISMTKAALDTAHGQMNMFAAGDKKLDKLTSVWVSNAVFSELKKNGYAVMAASNEGAKKFTVLTTPEEENGDLDVGNPANVENAQGRTKLLKTIHVRSEDGKENIWINDDAANPVITRMEIGWAIGLVNVE